MDLRPLSTAIGYVLILSVRGRLYTSEYDVYRRQILTYKDGPRTERVKLCVTTATQKQLLILFFKLRPNISKS